MPRRLLTSVGFISFVCGLAMASPAYSQPTGYEGYQVVRIAITSEAELETLRELEGLGGDFQIWSEALGIGPMEVRVAPAAKPLLDGTGLCYEVVIEDLQRHIDELYGSGRSGDFFDYLRAYDEHVEFMTDLVAAYPDLAEMVMLGLSVEGREMWALRITGPGKNKPGVMYHGAQHGNEQAGASVVAYAAQHLVTNYDTDPAVATLVDNVEWFLLPIMNPDGYEYYARSNANGVDLNRNWGGPGSGEDPTGGPYPFSEPETAAMRDFFLGHPNVRVHVDFHGYVDWIMWPWGHTGDLTIDHWTFHLLGSEVHDLIEAAGGGDYEIGTIWDVAYYVSGGSVDYSYGELGVWALAFELADAGLPEICEEFLPTMLFLSGWISDCNANGIPDVDDIAGGTSADCNANQVPDACESQADCNNDGVLDICDFAAAEDPDCNGNIIPDACDIDKGPSEDCTGNGVPDECEPDCNNNRVADSCDIADGTSQDCNQNEIPDECDPDCNGNGVPDSCDIVDGTSYDCNANGIPDECEPDCNENGVVDECDIADGTSQDDDINGVPDECQLLLFVNADAPAGGDGRTWETAYNDLQDALADLAEAADTLSMIWVAAGTYTPASPGGNRAATFQLISGVGIYGGFVGDETSLDERDAGANVTILSGDRNGDDGPDFANNGENSYHVVTGRATGATTVLDGFTITGGNADGGSGQNFGGGLYNHAGSPTLINCIVRGNSGTYGGGVANESDSNPSLTNCTLSENSADDGGGMLNLDGSNPTLTNCTFRENLANDEGGGMFNSDSSPTLINCTFLGNFANEDGAGMFNAYDSSPTLSDCAFSGNSAGDLGGGMKNDDSSPTLDNCTFSGNTSRVGGGIFHGGDSRPKVTNCRFAGNVADSGAGMYNEGGAVPTVANCIFTANSAFVLGGGMFNGGNPTLTNCTFIGNSAGETGGGMHNSGSAYPRLVNCAFTGNSANDHGGGMYNYNYSSPTLINCILSANSAGISGGGMYNYWYSNPTISNCILWGDTPDELFADVSNPSLAYTDIEGGWPGDGNIDLDPFFVDPDGADDIPGTEDDNFRLLMDSPCINAGDPSFIPVPDETDLDSHARVLCSRVDMGAYEFGIGDYDCDRVVDLTDFAAWQDCMTGPHSGPYSADCEPFDFDYDGDVDLTDFAGFQLVITEGNP